jgi:hypothetical protein
MSTKRIPFTARTSRQILIGETFPRNVKQRRIALFLDLSLIVWNNTFVTNLRRTTVYPTRSSMVTFLLQSELSQRTCQSLSCLRTLRGLYCPPRIPPGIRGIPGDSGNSGGIRFGSGVCQIGIFHSRAFRGNAARNWLIPGMETGITERN